MQYSEKQDEDAKSRRKEDKSEQSLSINNPAQSKVFSSYFSSSSSRQINEGRLI